MASIFDRIKQKATQALQGVGNFIDRDKSMQGVQLAQGGLGNKIAQTFSQPPQTNNGLLQTIGNDVGNFLDRSGISSVAGNMGRAMQETGRNIQSQQPIPSAELFPNAPAPVNQGLDIINNIAKFPVNLAGGMFESYGNTLDQFSTPEGRQEVGTSLDRVLSSRPSLDTLSEPSVEAGLNLADILPGGGLAIGAIKQLNDVDNLARPAVQNIDEILSGSNAVKMTDKIAGSQVDDSIDYLPQYSKELSDEVEDLERSIKLHDLMAKINPNLPTVQELKSILREKVQELSDVTKQLQTPKAKNEATMIASENGIIPLKKPVQSTAQFDDVIRQSDEIAQANTKTAQSTDEVLNLPAPETLSLPQPNSSVTLAQLRKLATQGDNLEGVQFVAKNADEAREALSLGINANKISFPDTGSTSVDTLFDNGGRASTKLPFTKKNPINLFKDWVNTREGFANYKSGDVKLNPNLTAFDEEGMQAITDLQSGNTPDKFKDIKKFTDELFEKEMDAGVVTPESYRDNYLPQLWDNTKEEVEAVFAKTFGNQPGFSKQRLFKDYTEGIKAGLTPKFNQLSDLLQSRAKKSTQAIADKEFITALTESGNALPLQNAPKGWKVIDQLQTGGVQLAVPPELAGKISNYLGEATPWLKKVANFVSEAKQSLLSAGIPKTGWNFHTGVNIPARAMAARNNPFGAAVDSMVWNTVPSTAVSYVKSIPGEIKDGLLKAGITVSRSADDAGYGFKPEAGKSLLSKARTGFDKLFSEAAFDKVLPAHKFKVATEAYERALKQGLSQEEAFRIGAETANTMFGGINVAEMGRNKDFQNIMRTFLLAPDWLESNVRIAGKTAGGLLNPKNWNKAEYAPYRKFATNAAFMYAGHSMLNKALSGHWPWENGAGQEFNLATGTYDERGRERMISPFGTAFDAARIPLQMVRSGLEGDLKGMASPIRNRLSPPVSALTSLFITGEDYRGRPIDTPGEVLGQVASGVGVPSQVTNIAGGMTGNLTPEESIAGILEAPVRYRGGANTDAKRKTATNLKDMGLSNEQVATTLNKKPESKNLLSGMFGGSSQVSAPTGKMSKADKDAYFKSIDEALFSEGTTIPPKEALAYRFFDNKTATSKSIEDRTKVFKSLKTVMENEDYSDEQKQAFLQASGAKPEEYEYYKLASKDKDVKLQELLPKIENMDEGQLVEFLMRGRRPVAGTQLVTSEMLTYLYENDYISKDAKEAVGALYWDEVNDRPYFSKAFKKEGSGAGKGLTPKQAQALFKVELPKMSAIKGVDNLLKVYQPGNQQSGGNEMLLENILKAPSKRNSGTKLWF